MEGLSEAKQGAIKKMCTVRLVKELIQRGWDEEEVEIMDRSQLEDEWAKVVAQGGDTPPEPEVVNTDILRTLAFESSQQTLERERLAFEQRRYEEEKIERKEREKEQRRREEKEDRERKEREQKEERERKEREEKEERELRRREEKEERERKEREEKEEREFELKTQQLELERKRIKKSADSKILADEDRAMRKSLASRIKFFNDALKGTVGKLPAMAHKNQTT